MLSKISFTNCWEHGFSSEKWRKRHVLCHHWPSSEAVLDVFTLMFLLYLNVFTSQATSEPVLDPQQIQAFDQLCHLYRGSSRVMFVWLNFYFFIYNCYFGNVVSWSPLKSTLLWPCGALAPGSNQNLAKDAKEVERCLPLTYLELWGHRRASAFPKPSSGRPFFLLITAKSVQNLRPCRTSALVELAKLQWLNQDRSLMQTARDTFCKPLSRFLLSCGSTIHDISIPASKMGEKEEEQKPFF